MLLRIVMEILKGSLSCFDLNLSNLSLLILYSYNTNRKNSVNKVFPWYCYESGYRRSTNMERTALIYYSLNGHTEFIAKKMSKQLDCTTIRLKLQKEFSQTNTFLQYFWAGKSAFFHDKPKLENKKIDLTQYDTLIIATPVWAGNISSPIRSFLSSYAIEGKQVYLVASDSGGPFTKCFTTMRKFLLKSIVHNEIGFVGVTKDTYPTHKEKLEIFCREILAGKKS